MSADQIAALFVQARLTRKPLGVPADQVIENDEGAYCVQDAVFAKLWPGARATAWKVGGPSDKAEPTAAPIPAQKLLRSPARVAGSGMSMIGVEAEIAYRLARDLPARGEPYADEEIAAAVSEVLVTIELCDTRLADWKNAPALWKLADFQSNGALIAGNGTRRWRGIDFSRQPVELMIGKKSVKAVGAHPFGNPFRLMPWIISHCAKRAGGLRAGDIVTTGSWTGLELARPGDEIMAMFPGIGEAKVRID